VRIGAHGLAGQTIQRVVGIGDRASVNSATEVRFPVAPVCKMAYAKTGQSRLARQQLQQAVKINPNSNDAAHLKKQLAQLKS